MSLLQRLFRRYTSDDVNEAEKEFIHGWYNSHESWPAENLSAQDEAAIRNSIWTKLNASLAAAGETPVIPMRNMRKLIIRYAAAAAMMTGVSLTIVRSLERKPVQYNLISVGSGQYKRVNLPDGSSILLESNSQINVPSEFSKQSREIIMPTGEASYDIAKDSSRPFIVHAGPLTVKVLGTSFHVRLLKGFNEQEVLVSSGKVQVSDGEKILGVLTRGSRLLYDTASKSFSIEKHKEKMADLIQEGWMVFENTSFAGFEATMKSHFDTEIIDPDHKLSKVHFTAAFPPSARLKDIMDVLAGIHTVTYRIEGKTLLIK